MENAQMPPSISIVADPICPWCYYGEHQLEKAIQAWGEMNPQCSVPIKVQWLPFLLVPEVPLSGMDRTAFLVQRLGAADGGPRLQAAYAAVRSTGLPFFPEKITRQPNSLYAHSLVQSSGDLQHHVAKAIAKAFFVEGEDIGDWKVLTAIAKNVGLPANVVSAARGAEMLSQVQENAIQIARRGINGVPFFIINETLGISGAQPSAVILEAFK